MNDKIKWGILGTADIAIEHVIPALLKGNRTLVQSIASRSFAKAEKVAIKFNIPKYYGSYEELLADTEVEALYIPLPNHLHVAWAIKALEAGKHVLVEKPLALSSSEAQHLLNIAENYPQIKIMEGFMYRHHPQWIKAKELIKAGAIGEVTTIQSLFSFYDNNPTSIVNNKEFGGGSLMDIGCYPISLSRFIFGAEPDSILASITYHPQLKVDTDATVIMKFGNRTSSFYSSIRSENRQQAQIFGTKGKIEFELPFNPIANKHSKLLLIVDGVMEEIVFELCDQYTIQADLFSLAILNDTKVPTPLIDGLYNLCVIERIIKSDKSESWA